MERFDLTKYRLDHLVEYKLSRNVVATEAKIYYLPRKTKWENEMKALKFFYNDMNDTKIDNIEFLADHREELANVDSLVIPDEIVSYYGVDRGITMPFIEHVNLADLLKFKKMNPQDKLKFLKSVGETLDDLSSIKKYVPSMQNFALGDLHEANILVEAKTGKVKIVDLDSVYTGRGIAPAKYLSNNSNLDNISNKYVKNEAGVIIPNEQTDLYCYHMMILNYLYGGNVARLSQEEFYYYLEYLKHIGVSEEFLDSCLRLYMNQENINPKEYLDSLEKIAPRAGKGLFEINKPRL